MAQQYPSPREYLQARRPERFSDSEDDAVAVIDRSVLEFHLDTLTSRSQEVDFERFARRLAELEICPNLLPHTGPTGGGDSKVDSETYPVAEPIADSWYTALGDEAATQRWAFAFSAKKKWSEKVKSDVQSIVGTGRGYRRVFFVSNQSIRDKARAKLEDDLRKKHGVDVRILDRTWILDRVFANHHEQIAVEELHLGAAATRRRRLGPRDAAREVELAEIEKRIQEAAAAGHHDFRLVEDCLEAADLSRQLDRPRVETDGRYERAARLARKHGTPHHHVEAVYEHAWTTFFWFEDVERTSEIYGQVEALVANSTNVRELEFLSNLRNVLYAAVDSGRLDPAVAEVPRRTKWLIERLGTIERDVHRPSSALQARSLVLMTRLMPPGQDTDLTSIFAEFEGVVREAADLVGYPFESLAAILTELGDVAGNIDGYESLYATLIEVVSRRTGETATARMLARRGGQLLDEGKAAEATRTFGRALALLFKHESRYDLVKTLYLLSIAYEKLDLLWAARGTALTAGSVALNEFWTYSTVTPLQLGCFDRLKWLELRLGRVPHTLSWLELHLKLSAASRSLEPEDSEADHEPRTRMYDFALGMLLLRATLEQLPRLARLPSTLQRLGLQMSSVALRFALGDPTVASVLPEEDGPVTPMRVEEFFQRWAAHPAARDVAAAPALYDQPSVEIDSRILGCRIRVSADRNGPAVEVATSVLAALEALLSVGVADRVVSRVAEATMSVRVDVSASKPITYAFEDRGGHPHVAVVTSGFDAQTVAGEVRSGISDVISHIVLELLPRAFLIESIEEVVAPWFRDDQAMHRAVGVAGSIGTLGNVVGDATQSTFSLEHWIDPNEQEVPLTRAVQWKAVKPPTSRPRTHAKPATGPPPPDLAFGPDIPQRDIRSDSLIREQLWARAGWRGAAFLGADPRTGVPPVFGMMFEDPDAGMEIFRLLVEELGQRDEHERLRIAIIRGIRKSSPAHWRLVVSSNVSAMASGDDDSERMKYFVLRSIVRTMDPPDSRNLDAFLVSYQQVGEYQVAPAVAARGGVYLPPHLAITKRELVVRQAYELGRNDPDNVALQGDDDIAIPAGMVDVPALEIIARRKAAPRG